MRRFLAAMSALSMGLFGCTREAPQTPELMGKWSDRSFFSLSADSLEGERVDLSAYAGKVCLVVNTASECGFTPQYEGLQALHASLADQGLVVLGFPSNDFGGQEPGSAEEIRSFCTGTYQVTFPMFAKVQTKPGPGQSEIYEFLGTRTGELPGWNFGKYLVGRDGAPIAFFASTVKPDSAELRQAIETALAAKAGA